MHIVPARKLLGLKSVRETFEAEDYTEGRVDCEIVSHDILKYFRLLLKNNGYVLEQVFSPLVIIEGILPRLRPIAMRCITKQHYKHYCGFSTNEWTQFHRRPEKHVKRILYVFRILLTGIYLMRTGRVEANINVLNDEFKLSYIPDLIRQKLEGYEHGELAAGHGIDFYQRQFEALSATLEEEYTKSPLPERADGFDDLEKLLLELRQVG
jgi:predicted nucleotidyltransferase